LAEILQVRGLPILIRRGPVLLLLDVQCLALGGRGYLGLNRGHLGLDRGCLGLGRVVDIDRGLMQILREDVQGNRRSSRGYFCQLVRSLVVAPSDVVKLEPVELVFQAPNLIAVGSIFRSRQWEFFMTWSMTSCESSRASRRLTPSSMAIRNPLTRASYSATLLDAGKWRRST
jgi:hypothetical protein